MYFSAALRIALVTVIRCLPLVCFADCVSSELKAPLGYYLPVMEGKGVAENNAYLCEAPPPPYTGSLQFTSKYDGSDPNKDQVNVDAQQQGIEETADISLLEKSSVNMADNYLLGNPGVAARNCLIEWLEVWASADALLSKDSNHTGKAVRNWALASVASAYFLVKSPNDAPEIDLTKRQLIENWFAKLADQVVVDWSDRPDSLRNNHDYWAAWSVMITGVMLNRQDLFSWGNSGLRMGLAQIDQDGFLPNELARGSKALSYHIFAIKPLVMIAVFAETNKTALTSAEKIAFNKLVYVTTEGLRDPSLFQQKAGVEQIIDVSGSGLAWMEPYVKYFGGNALFSPYFDAYRPMKTTQLGGNLTRIFNIGVSSLALPPIITEIKVK